MELATYLSVLLLSAFFSLENKPVKSDILFFVLYLIVCLVLSLVVRFDNFDVDIHTYAGAMSSTSFSFYFLREPVVWLGQRYLFNIVGSEIAVFVVFDMFLLVLLYCALKNYKVPQYSYFSLICFFPFLLGMQNVYRQWVAVIFVLLSFSFFYRKTKSRYFSFLLAGLSHNVAGLFSSALFLISKRKIEKVVGVLFLIFTPLMISLAADTKSQVSTGKNLVFAYFVLILFISFVMILSSRLKIRLHERKSYIILGCVFYSSIATALLLTSTGAERTAMFSLVLLYPQLANFFEWHFKQKVLLRLSLIAFGFAPLLLFGTRHFVL